MPGGSASHLLSQDLGPLGILGCASAFPIVTVLATFRKSNCSAQGGDGEDADREARASIMRDSGASGSSGAAQSHSPVNGAGAGYASLSTNARD